MPGDLGLEGAKPALARPERARPPAPAPVPLAVGATAFGRNGTLSAHSVLALQRTAGNAAVALLLRDADLSREPAQCDCGGIEHGGEECEECREGKREPGERQASRVVARQVTPPLPGGPGGGPNVRCLELLGQILSFVHGGLTHILGGQTFTGTQIKRGLIERFRDMVEDKADIYNRYRYKSTPGPGGLGSWEGHQEQFEMQQRGLRNRLTEYIRNNCNDPSGGLPAEAANAYDEALEWATRPTPREPAPKPAAPRTEESISWSDVVDVLVVIGLSIALVAAVIAALADPEPVSKVALAVGSVALATLILVRLGLLRELDPAEVASQEGYPEQDEATV